MEAEFKIEDGILTKYEGSAPAVTVPDGVTEIGPNAFSGNKTLKELVLPHSVIRIGSSAFENCTKLKSVAVSQNLEEIGSEAFQGCKALKELHLPDTLRSIGYGAFGNCPKLARLTCNSQVYQADQNPFNGYQEEPPELLFDSNGFLIFRNILFEYRDNAEVITVPEGVTQIYYQAFCHEPYLGKEKLQVKKIVLPDSVKSIGGRAFAGCEKLQEIQLPQDVAVGIQAFAGCKGLADKNGLVIVGNKVYDYLGNSTEVEIPAGVEILERGLFDAGSYDCNPANKNLTKVVLPQGLKEIGNEAFKGCDCLREINIPDSVQIIGAGAFLNCASLETVTVPPTAQVQNMAFAGCRCLADEKGYVIVNNYLFQCLESEAEMTVPDTVTQIGTGAFKGLRMQKITLPAGLVQLGAAFAGCHCLEEIRIPEGITAIAPSAFENCTTLKSVSLPQTLTQIGSYAFRNCQALERLEIPRGVTQIGSSVLEGCTALHSLTLPADIKEIPDSLCENCRQLQAVTIGAGVETIGYEAFRNCTSLQKITLSAGVKTVKARAFAQCEALRELTVENPACQIDLEAFEECSALVDRNCMKIINGVLVEYIGKGGHVTVPDTVHTLAPNVFREGWEYDRRNPRMFRKEGSLQSVCIPAGVKTIGSGAFRGCKNLEQVTFASGVTGIGEDAFHDCTALKEIKLPATVEVLGDGVFAGCVSLTALEIPAGVTDMGSGAFLGCENLEEITVDGENPAYAARDGILYSKDKTRLLCCPGGIKLGEFTVPDGVTAIGSLAFQDCKGINKIVIPAGVKKLGDRVFPRAGWRGPVYPKILEIAMGAGEDGVGEEVIGFPLYENLLVYPTVPVSFPREQTDQVRLAMGFCQEPGKYSGAYAEEYRKFAQSHQRTILKKAQQLQLPQVEAYFAEPEEEKKAAAYQPDLSLKKPSELRKVEILEETVVKGTLEDLQAVLDTYKTFELTARALGLAARYRGVDFVKLLLDRGATFAYTSTPALDRKYGVSQQTAAGAYHTEYYLLLVQEKVRGYYGYTAMCGVDSLNITEAMEEKVLPVEDRLAVVRLLMEREKACASADCMLFWAITRGETAFADGLMAMGVNLRKGCFGYYDGWGIGGEKYLDVVTTAGQSVYHQGYVAAMAALPEDAVLPALERLHTLAAAADGKLVITQKMFNEMSWTDGSLAFVLEHADMSRVNQKSALEKAVDREAVAALAIMAEAGWLAQRTKREALIDLAREQQKTNALAWLLDFKNRTVDVAAEAAREEEKAMRELMADPNSVTVLKKIWGYKKLEDGTLKITNYKGCDTEVTVPEKIGKNPVTVIGEDAFSTQPARKQPNQKERGKITRVILPEGIREIEYSAFFRCQSLESITLPSTLEAIGNVAFRGCTALKDMQIPEGVKTIGKGAFWECGHLYTGDFLIVAGILMSCKGNPETVTVPEGVTEIGDGVFYSAFGNSNLREVKLPGSLQRIGNQAFYRCGQLTCLELPAGLREIGAEAFYRSGLQSLRIPEGTETIGTNALYSAALQDLYVPRSVTKIAKECFGWGSSGLVIHTQPGAPIIEFVKKNYSRFRILLDYDEEEGKAL